MLLPWALPPFTRVPLKIGLLLLQSSWLTFLTYSSIQTRSCPGLSTFAASRRSWTKRPNAPSPEGFSSQDLSLIVFQSTRFGFFLASFKGGPADCSRAIIEIGGDIAYVFRHLGRL